MNIVILGLSITSSWGNGHATTYRALVEALTQRGHGVFFLERDQPWYAEHRDLARPPYCRTAIYGSLEQLEQYADEVSEADCVIVGSYVPDGAEVCSWALQTARGVTAFYDIDTPVTLAKLARGEHEYLTPELIPLFDLYLSFTGGPTLGFLERELRARHARALYCSVDPRRYHPEPCAPRWDLGYLGTYSADRQPALERLLVAPAEALPRNRFAVVGPLYPEMLRWPANVERTSHLGPEHHRGFYNAQRFALNLTRTDMVRAGWSPSVRLFEAAACGTPIVSDSWEGIDHFFTPGREILIVQSSAQVVEILRDLPEAEARAIGEAARARVLAEHTAEHRALELEQMIHEASATRFSMEVAS